jgi:hypothetical protein
MQMHTNIFSCNLVHMHICRHVYTVHSYADMQKIRNPRSEMKSGVVQTRIERRKHLDLDCMYTSPTNHYACILRQIDSLIERKMVSCRLDDAASMRLCVGHARTLWTNRTLYIVLPGLGFGSSALACVSSSFPEHRCHRTQPLGLGFRSSARACVSSSFPEHRTQPWWPVFKLTGVRLLEGKASRRCALAALR